MLLSIGIGEWLKGREDGRGEGSLEAFDMLLMTSDSSLDHVSGNRAGTIGVRDIQVQHQQDLGTD